MLWTAHAVLIPWANEQGRNDDRSRVTKEGPFTLGNCRLTPMVKRSKAGALKQQPSPPKKVLHTAQTHTPPACLAYVTTTET